MLTLGKRLGGGFPAPACPCSQDVAEAVHPADHAGTYVDNPRAAAAEVPTLRVLPEEKLVERSAWLCERLQTRLRAFAKKHPQLASRAQGRELLQGLVLADEEPALALPLRALNDGILTNVITGRLLSLFSALNIPRTS